MQIIARLQPLALVLQGLALWETGVRMSGVPAFLLPPPSRVAAALWNNGALLLGHAGITLAEIVLGLGLGTLLGAACALAMTAWPGVARRLMPALVASQALPVFALAPLLVLWLGYGLASKVAMAVLVIFFPVASAFTDGLRRTEPGWLEMARVMGASPYAILWQVRLPAALPAFASGLRVAAAVAPIGAVIGEWVGASAGLGFLMLRANARMQTDLMFAALVVLGTMAVLLHALVDRGLTRLLPWAGPTDSHSNPGGDRNQ